MPQSSAEWAEKPLSTDDEHGGAVSAAAQPPKNKGTRSPRRPFGVLTAAEIRKERIVLTPDGEPTDDKCYQPASCDLRLGHEYFVPVATEKGDVKTLDIKSCEGGDITIPRFSCVFVSTYEIIHTPNNVVGRFNLRFKIALEGLFVQMGMQVEPGYKGRLFAMLQNISDREITLKYKDIESRPFSIEFSYTHSEAIPKQPKREYNSFYDFMPRYRATGTINTIVAELENAQEDIKNSAIGKFSIRSATITGAIILGVTLAITLVSSAIPSLIAPFVANDSIERSVKYQIENNTKIKDITSTTLTLIDAVARIQADNERLLRERDATAKIHAENERLRREIASFKSALSAQQVKNNSGVKGQTQ